MRVPELDRPAVAPIGESERIAALDAMRGLAILGVLVAYAAWSLGGPPADTWTAADRVTARAVELFVDNKLLTMFACLFGVGITQQWRRWEAAGDDVVPLHLRRLSFLLGVGLVHAFLLRNGDILAPYALLGFTLLLFRGRGNLFVGTAAGVLIAAAYAVPPLMSAAGMVWPDRPSAGGNYLVENARWVKYWYLTLPFSSWPKILALMLFGILIGRARLLERGAADVVLARRLVLTALPLAVITRLGFEALQYGRGDRPPTAAYAIALDLVYQLSSWTLAAFYGAGLLLLSYRGRPAALLAPLRTLGRMAFTNYLLQATILVPVCLAFGLFDTVTPTRGVALGLGVALAQYLFSAWWLRRHAMGPLERLWRRATYGGAIAGNPRAVIRS